MISKTSMIQGENLTQPNVLKPRVAARLMLIASRFYIACIATGLSKRWPPRMKNPVGIAR
jgi:hypothetical protein